MIRFGAAYMLDRLALAPLLYFGAGASAASLAILAGAASPTELAGAGILHGAAAAIYVSPLQKFTVLRSRDLVRAVTAFRVPVTMGAAIATVAGARGAQVVGYAIVFDAAAVLAALAATIFFFDQLRNPVKSVAAIA